MNRFRKLLILSINAVVAAWWLNLIFGKDTNTDFLGILLIAVLLFMVAFNIYALIIVKLFLRKEVVYTELLFTVLLAIPFFLLWYLTT
jgi:hypothetical protein